MSKSPSYQSVARTFRPQKFSEVLGQNPVVTTLSNALAENRLAHAYLFAGARCSGKTTLARTLAKALCCTTPQGIEPCGTCSSCCAIQSGSSLDVIEIDGASHRGIDDIRSLNETTIYAPSSSQWKIYIIDEVHKLTKEAFNALLKTLEEPPEQVKFFFATTEPHKVLPTILSRCQRFDLARISEEVCCKKLAHIAQSLRRSVAPEALEILSKRAEGSLRDAESLLEQLFSYTTGAIAKETLFAALGMSPAEDFLAIDQAVLEQNYHFPFSFARQLLEQGKDLSYFLEQLFIHFRNHFLRCLDKKPTPYAQDTLLHLFDAVQKAQRTLPKTTHPLLTLEMLFLDILRAQKRVSLSELLERLETLRSSLLEKGNSNSAKIPPQEESKTQPLPPEKPSPLELVPLSFSLDTPTPAKKTTSLQEKVRQDTLLRFASVVLEGRLEQ